MWAEPPAEIAAASPAADGAPDDSIAHDRYFPSG
jgi:hypothetical protein